MGELILIRSVVLRFNHRLDNSRKIEEQFKS